MSFHKSKNNNSENTFRKIGCVKNSNNQKNKNPKYKCERDINIKFFLFRLTNFYTYHIKSTGYILDPYFRLDSKMHEFFKE